VFADTPAVEFAAIDCVAHQSIMKTFDVKSFPMVCALISSPGGEARDFGSCDFGSLTGASSKDEIVEWVEGLLGDAKIKRGGEEAQHEDEGESDSEDDDGKAGSSSSSGANAGGSGSANGSSSSSSNAAGSTSVTDASGNVNSSSINGDNVNSSSSSAVKASRKDIVSQVAVREQDLAATILFGLEQVRFDDGTLHLGSDKGIALTSWLRTINSLLQPSDDGSLGRLVGRLSSWDGGGSGDAILSSDEWQGALASLKLWGHHKGTTWDVCAGPDHGYPCGLWQVFHALTVAANDADAQATLLVVRSYVAHFFGCGPCQKHFAHAATTIEEQVNSRRSAMLWLWQLHNNVSARLAADWDTEAALVAYPSVATCSPCHSEVGFDEQQVEAFLIATYTTAPRSHQVLRDWANPLEGSRGLLTGLGMALVLLAAVVLAYQRNRPVGLRLRGSSFIQRSHQRAPSHQMAEMSQLIESEDQQHGRLDEEQHTRIDIRHRAPAMPGMRSSIGGNEVEERDLLLSSTMTESQESLGTGFSRV